MKFKKIFKKVVVPIPKKIRHKKVFNYSIRAKKLYNPSIKVKEYSDRNASIKFFKAQPSP